MTTLQRIELTCPCCSAAVSSQAVASTNSFGGKRTDFHERAAGTQPLPYLVHLCRCCGFVGCECDFKTDDLSEHVKQRIHARWGPTDLDGAPPIVGSDKYERAALIAEWNGRERRHVADLWLRAAWCTVDEGDLEAERYYRRKAAVEFAVALGSFDGVASGERAVLHYLVGELWRRVGDAKRAREWFDKVPAEVTNPEEQAWVVDAARQQRDCPREWFG